MKAGPQGDIGDVAGVGDGRSAEEDLDVDVLAALLGPGRLDMVSEEPDAKLADERSRPGLVLRLGRRAAGDRQRGQQKEAEHTTRTPNSRRNGHEIRHTLLRRNPRVARASGAPKPSRGTLA